MSTGINSDLDDLLVPLSAELPCGLNIRYESDYDLLQIYRREDDVSLPTGVWKAEVKRGDWSSLEQLARSILTTRSKDLMVAAWLGEAWLHQQGIAGLPRALQLISTLCERYEQDLHPVPEDGDLAWRGQPLEWLVKRYSEILHNRLPLFAENSEFASFTYYEWQKLIRQQVLGSDNAEAKKQVALAKATVQRLNELARSTELDNWRQRLSYLQRAGVYLQQLEDWSERALLEHAPSFQPLRNIIDGLSSLMQEYINLHPTESVDEPLTLSATESLVVESEASPASPSQVQSMSAPTSREAAYRQLAVIANYLAKTEPHSPVPYMVNRAVEWGAKPLSELLGELLNSDPEVRRVWTLLGVIK